MRFLFKIRTLFWRWWYTKVHPSSSEYTREQAIELARKHGLEKEILMAMEHGCTPDEALLEWDIFPYQSTPHKIRF